MNASSVDRLRRFASRATDHRTCDLCRSDLKDQHRHLLELVHQRILCACDACALLFSDAQGSRIRPIPQTVTRIDLNLGDEVWAGLGIPIGIAFFTVREPTKSPSRPLPRPTSPIARGEVTELVDLQAGEVTIDSRTVPVMVGYPSPAGLVMSNVEQNDWQALLRANTDVSRLRPEVESLLIDRTARRRQAFVVPLDVCFELIGIIRRHWDGWSGGPDVHRAIDRFFDQLDQSAVVVQPATSGDRHEH